MIIKLYRKFQDAMQALLGLVLGFLIVIIFAQVIMRYVFHYGLPWSEELCRYLFVWIIFIGCSLGVRDNSEMKIDMLELALHGKARAVLLFIQNVFSLIAATIAFISCIHLLEIGKLSISPNLQLPMYIVYIGPLVGFAMVLLEIVYKIVSPFFKKSDHDEVEMERMGDET